MKHPFLKEHRHEIPPALPKRAVGDGSLERPLTGIDIDQQYAFHSSQDLKSEVGPIKRELFELLNQLPQMDRDVLTLRYGLGGSTPLTHREIGEQYGQNRSWAQNVEETSLTKLQELYSVY